MSLLTSPPPGEDDEEVCTGCDAGARSLLRFRRMSRGVSRWSRRLRRRARPGVKMVRRLWSIVLMAARAWGVAAAGLRAEADRRPPDVGSALIARRFGVVVMVAVLPPGVLGAAVTTNRVRLAKEGSFEAIAKKKGTQRAASSKWVGGELMGSELSVCCHECDDDDGDPGPVLSGNDPGGSLCLG